MTIWQIDKQGRYLETTAVSFVFKIKENTATNNHTTNAMLIAKNYGTLEEQTMIEELIAVHDFAGSLNRFETMARDYIVKKMVERIKPKKFADDILASL